MRFLGNIEAKLDAKCRVFIPAQFRRTLQAEGQLALYLRKDSYENCIVIYPATVWENELSILRAKLNKWKPEEQALYRQFMLEAVSVEMDASGRILIPKALLNLCRINSDVRFLGVDDTIELWDKSTLEAPRLDSDAFKQQLISVMCASENTTK